MMKCRLSTKFKMRIREICSRALLAKFSRRQVVTGTDRTIHEGPQHDRL